MALAMLAQLEREASTFGSQVPWRNSAEAEGCEHPKVFLKKKGFGCPPPLTCAGQRSLQGTAKGAPGGFSWGFPDVLPLH